MATLDAHLTRILVAIVEAHRTRAPDGRRWPMLHIREGGMEEGIHHPAWTSERDDLHVGREDLRDLAAYGLLDITEQRNSWLISPTAEGMEAADTYQQDLSVASSDEYDLDEESSPMPEVTPRTTSGDPRTVMVVYGRNRAARAHMFSFLRAIGLQPLEFSELTGSGSGSTSQAVYDGFARAQAVVVLLVPEDLAHLGAPYLGEDEEEFERVPTGQARPNVIFEMGRSFATHPDTTVIVELGRTRPISDVAGLHTVRLNGRPEPLRDLARRLERAGCPVNRDGDDWQEPDHYPGLNPRELPPLVAPAPRDKPNLAGKVTARSKPTDERTPPPPEVAANIAQQGRAIPKTPGAHSTEID